MDNATESFGENDKRTQNWQIQLNKAQAELNGMELELSENEKALDSVGDEFQDSTTDADKFGNEVENSADQADNAGSRFEKLGGVLKGLGATMVAVAVAAGAAAIKMSILQNKKYKEHEQMGEQFSILIDSRSRFETGQPGGEWLTLPATAEQLHDAMQRVGITADNPQDFFINGFETPIEAVTRLTLDNLQQSNIDELNYLAAELSQLDPREVATLNAAGEVLDIGTTFTGFWNTPTTRSFHVLIPGVFTPVQLWRILPKSIRNDTDTRRVGGGD